MVTLKYNTFEIADIEKVFVVIQNHHSKDNLLFEFTWTMSRILPSNILVFSLPNSV